MFLEVQEEELVSEFIRAGKPFKRKQVKKQAVFKCDVCSKTWKESPRKRQINKPRHYCSRACMFKCSVHNKNRIDGIKKSSPEAQKKLKTTLMKKYGVENIFQLEAVKNKTKNTLIEKYGVENVSSLEKIKEKKRTTCLENYGVEYPLQSKELKEKQETTMLDKYGVKHSMHNEDLASKAMLNGAGRAVAKKYTTKMGDDITIQGSYEELFVKFCEENNIRVENGPCIAYNKGRERKYFIDFLITRKDQSKALVEIKSTYWYNKYRELVDVKNEAATEYAESNGMQFCFIINDNKDKKINLNAFNIIKEG